VRRPILLSLVVAIAAIAGFLVGRRTTSATAAPTGAPDRDSRGDGGPSDRAPAPPIARGARAATGSATSPSSAVEPRSPAPDGGVATAPTEELRAAREALAEAEKERLAERGTPIPMPKTAPSPRFEQGALRGAVASALVQAKVPGSVDGVDCSEYPCIVYGRIKGTEDEIEPVERAAALGPYASDISVIILWTENDEAAEEEAEKSHRGAGALEQMLFSISYYSRADGAQHGDDLDRRIRWRTMDLWSSISPTDETGGQAGQPR
jgi:hypothetical protein